MNSGNDPSGSPLPYFLGNMPAGGRTVPAITGDIMRTPKNQKLRLVALTVMAFVLMAALVGCTNTADDTTPAAPTNGLGGTMMNKPAPSAAGNAIITAKVKSALIADAAVGADGINVDTISGTVVVRGKVKTAAAKQSALADAKKIQGVKRVIDQLAVIP